MEGFAVQEGRRPHDLRTICRIAGTGEKETDVGLFRFLTRASMRKETKDGGFVGYTFMQALKTGAKLVPV